MSAEDSEDDLEELDLRILSLLNQRAELFRTGGDPTLHQRRRLEGQTERFEALERAHDALGGAFPKQGIRPVFREIISACLALEESLSVAYLGPPGTFTHMAARSLFGSTANYLDSITIPAVFDAVARSMAQLGVVPIENSTEGGVSYTLDCLIEYDLCIRNELVLDVAQCLLALHSDISRIENVYSHPQGLAQCRTWLAKHLPHAQLVVSPSTTTAAKQAASDEKCAAVASSLAAELYGLEVVRNNIQDQVHNATRFFVLAHTDAPRSGRDKTSLVFSTPHKKGALRAVLEVFDDEGLNLTRIESRPYGSRLWEYAFFTDLEGHRTDPPVTRALARLQSTCGQVKVLGSYPRSS